MNKANLTAYEVVTEENLTDIHSTGWLLRHKKTGARVMLIELALFQVNGVPDSSCIWFAIKINCTGYFCIYFTIGFISICAICILLIYRQTIMRKSHHNK